MFVPLAMATVARTSRHPYRTGPDHAGYEHSCVYAGAHVVMWACVESMKSAAEL